MESVPLLSLEIFHLGEIREVALAMNSTVAELRSAYQEIHREKIDRISFQGRELQSAQRLGPDCGLHSGDRLIGNISVIIAEKESDKQTLIDVNDSVLVRELKQLYANKEKRILLPGTILLRNDLESEVGDGDSLFNCGIRDDSHLNLITPAFQIRIREKDSKEDGMTIKIFDHYRARQLKDLFNQNSARPLGFNDKLIFKEDELNDSIPVYKVGVTADSTLIVEREDITQERFEYICADCGSDVRLTKSDAVRCRECGNRIVYKKRTKKPCQYLAR